MLFTFVYMLPMAASHVTKTVLTSSTGDCKALKTEHICYLSLSRKKNLEPLVYKKTKE
jgi:hypothetical protein